MSELTRQLQQKIHGQKRTAEMMEKSEELLRQITENIQEVFFVVDHKDYQVLYVSPSYEEIWGQTCESLLKSPTAWLEAIFPEDRERVLAALDNQRRTGEFDEEFRIVRPDKSLRWIHDRVFPIRNARGEVYRLVGTALDITKRKQAEEALKVSQAKYQDLYDNAPDMFASVDTTGKIVECNQTLAVATGYTKKEIIGHPIFDMYHPDCVEDAKTTFESFVGTGEVHDAELELKRQDGSKIEVSLNVSAVLDEQGKILHSRSIWRVITKRKQAEKEIQRLNEELEQRVIDRTTQLKVANKKLEDEITERKRAEEELQHDQKQLKALVSELSRAEEAERRRIATELHEEISQTLALSKIKCQTLQERLPSSEDSALAGEIGELVAEVINHMRSLIYELSPTVLYEVGLEAGIEWLAEQSQNKYGLVCQFQSDQKPKPLDHDTSVVLFQSVRELLANAVHHGHARHAKITCWREDSQTGILVEDDGVGFDSTRIESLPSAKGGFGLFNIRERVEALGGRFEIASEHKEGTQVRLLVPLERGKG